MDRRGFLKLMGAAAAGMALPNAAFAEDRTMSKKNVLFIAVDDLRPQLGCYDHRQMQTPNLDALAGSGTAFKRAYCQEAICAPSRASLLTGCRPDTTTIYDLHHPVRTVMPDVLTLPQHFKNHGYHTYSIGKIYHHADDDPQGWSEPPFRATGDWGGRGYLLDENKKLAAKGKGVGPAVECADVPDNAYADGKNTDRAIEKLRELKDKPFFLAMGYFKPHLPFNAPKKYWDLYKRDEIDLASNPFAPHNVPEIAMHNWGELRKYHGMPNQGPVPEEKARELIHGYYACTSYIDAQIGRLLDELDRLGLRENTVVVVWGDHGWQLGEHGLWCKHSNFETSAHAPLIFSAPGMKDAGRPTDALVEFVDIYPTLCEIAGLPLPEHLEGTSLVPVLNDTGRKWKSAAFSQYPRYGMGYSMRTDRYRFTLWMRNDGEAEAVELYDHQVDPCENDNIAGHPENAELVKQLTRQLKSGWRGALPD